MHMWRTFMCPMVIGKLSLMHNNVWIESSSSSFICDGSDSSIGYMIVKHTPHTHCTAVLQFFLNIFLLLLQFIYYHKANIVRHRHTHTLTERPPTTTNDYVEKYMNVCHKQWTWITKVFPIFACNGTVSAFDIVACPEKYDNNSVSTNEKQKRKNLTVKSCRFWIVWSLTK